MARSGAPSKRRPHSTDDLLKFDGAELVDGTILTSSVFWESRLQGVLLLDGSRTFYPAAQVKRCWWDEPEDEVDGEPFVDGD